MNRRRWMLVGSFGTLLLTYALFFTDWVRPVPIEIASQVRFAIQPPRFGRPVKKVLLPGGLTVTNIPVPPEKRVIDPAPGGVANVTFTLDAYYHLTRVRVEDVPADGSAPRIMWEVAGKSRPTRSLLYSRVPEGMQPVGTRTNAEFLTAGAPYRLLVEAGRRRGTNHFTTSVMRSGQ